MPWLIFAYPALLAATAGALVARWRYARTLALILFAVELTSLGIDFYVIPDLAYGAVRRLRIAHALSPDVSFWTYHLWNQYSFRLLTVNVPANAGPWLLIALYAWRVPMRALPDDGSPFPRRYCAHCHYNLHGLESDQCPECGSRLEAGATSSWRLPRHCRSASAEQLLPPPLGGGAQAISTCLSEQPA